ncbi:hypothetical protein RTP6_003596 [Batrachochytrium dendrobatidis]
MHTAKGKRDGNADEIEWAISGHYHLMASNQAIAVLEKRQVLVCKPSIVSKAKQMTSCLIDVAADFVNRSDCCCDTETRAMYVHAIQSSIQSTSGSKKHQASKQINQPQTCRVLCKYLQTHDALMVMLAGKF